MHQKNHHFFERKVDTLKQDLRDVHLPNIYTKCKIRVKSTAVNMHSFFMPK